MKKAKMIVFAKAVAGARDDLNTWYDSRHIPDLLAVPGVVATERFDLSPIKCPEGSPGWDFMSIYSLEGEDIGAVLKEMGSRMGTDAMPTSPALDSANTLAYLVTAKE